ncbi:hypothetical protein KFK09_022649 [Dendrobium nobile]|uniref:Uncharacterized protein n=1 Tax=Dendrobium nobile TaxID=94219 RepID=A0A8T3AJA6_DENNO|nr:hypothetical protein KFK09_022649 [Dendrobium nobile]
MTRPSARRTKGHDEPPCTSEPWQHIHGWETRHGAIKCLTPRRTCPQPIGLRRNLRSKTRWFAGFCNSHHISHFAALFIDARAEISIAESRVNQYGVRQHPIQQNPFMGLCFKIPLALRCADLRVHPSFITSPTQRGDEAMTRVDFIAALQAPLIFTGSQNRSLCFSLDNDPSAGSPTETLLRLLLPLNDKVQWTSRRVTSSEPPASQRSEHFTGPFNR